MKLNKASVSKQFIFEIEHPEFGELIYQFTVDSNGEAGDEKVYRGWRNYGAEDLPPDLKFDVQEWVSDNGYFGLS